MKKLLLGSVAAMAMMGAAPSFAEDGFSNPEAGDIMVRVRGIGVIPNESDDLAGATVEVDDAYVPELDFTYFFTPNIAAELILATAPHDVGVKGGADLGEVWLLPPTLTAQYHFTDLGRFKPYVGAGINYTIFYNESSGDVSSMSYDNSFGWALQAGIDYQVADRWYLNADVKRLWLSTDAKVGGVGTVEVDIDPWIVGIGVGYRF
ncbi:MAG: OmpW family protein [Pseudomonadota bacterium]